MKILNVKEQSINQNGRAIDLLIVTASDVAVENLNNELSDSILFEDMLYTGYTSVKTYSYNMASGLYTIELEKLPEIEQKIRELSNIVLINPDKMSLEEYKDYSIEQTKDYIDIKLRCGIVYDGQLYNACKDKQNLLANQLGLYMVNAQAGEPDELSWNTKDGVCIDGWSPDELRKLGNAMKAAAKPLQKKQQEAELRIKAAINREEIDIIMQEFM